MSFKADHPQSYSGIELRAVGVREVLGLSLDDQLPGQHLFERLDRFFVKLDGRSIQLSYAVSDLPAGVEARACFDQNNEEFVVTLSDESYSGLERNEPRSRFSLAHEIGHVVLHPEQLVRMAHFQHEIGLKRGKATHKNYLDTEWQANSFGGALLMPARALRKMEKAGTLSVAAIQERFAVSNQAASIRLDVYQQRKWQLVSPRS